jgi:hypothetical protein
LSDYPKMILPVNRYCDRLAALRSARRAVRFAPIRMRGIFARRGRGEPMPFRRDLNGPFAVIRFVIRWCAIAAPVSAVIGIPVAARLVDAHTMGQPVAAVSAAARGRRRGVALPPVRSIE